MATSTTTLLPNGGGLGGLKNMAGGNGNFSSSPFSTLQGQNNNTSTQSVATPTPGGGAAMSALWHNPFSSLITPIPTYSNTTPTTPTPQSGVGTSIISGGGAKITPTYSGFSQLNGKPVSATNPQATAAQLQANVAAEKFQGLVKAQGNTVPPTAVTAATTPLANISNDTGTIGSNNLNNTNTAMNTLGSIAQNQTPAVTNAENSYNQFAQSNPYMLAAQSNPNVAADIASGRSSLLGQTFAAELAAKQAAVSNALTGQGQQVTSAENQGGLGIAGTGQQVSAANSAGNLANTAQGNQISARNSALNAIQPQLGAYGQTYYQPTLAGTNQGGVGNITGPAASGVANGESQAGQTYAQNQAILGKVSAQLPALSSLIQSSGYNADPVSYMNQIQQWGAGKLSNSSIPEVQGSLNDIVGALSQVLGVPSSGASDFRTKFAGSIVDGLQQGKSIEQSLQFAIDQATAGNAGYLKGAMNSGNSGSSSTSTTDPLGIL